MQTLNSFKPEIGETFSANGKNYIIEEKLSIARAIESSKIELELFDMNVSNFKATLIAIYNDLNGTNPDKTIKFADGAVKVHNLINKMNKAFTMDTMPVLRYCALFINEENEDRRIITDQMIADKINDWQEGGYELISFFLLLLSLVKGGKEEFKKFIQDISNPNEHENVEQ